MNTAEIMPLAHAMELRLTPEFDARLAALKLPELKALARACRANTRGCVIRTHWVEGIKQRWRSEIWDEIGVQMGVHPQRVMRFFIK